MAFQEQQQKEIESKATEGKLFSLMTDKLKHQILSGKVGIQCTIQAQEKIQKKSHAGFR